MYALSVLIVIDPITDFANKSNPSVGSLYTYSANESLIINPIQKVNQKSDITIPDTSLRFFFQFEYFDIEKQNFRIITKTELQNLFGSKNSELCAISRPLSSRMSTRLCGEKEQGGCYCEFNIFFKQNFN